MKPKSKLLSLLLAICLVAGLMPTAALAADGDKTIMLGTSGIKDPTAEGSTYYTPNSYIYFGMNGETPIKWRVLDADKANDNSTGGMFLLSEYLLASGVQFEAAWNSDDGDGQTNPNEWQHSDAQVWCKTFASNTSNFSAAEQSAMLGIAKTDSTESNLYSLNWGESSLTADDKMFFLSVRELADYVGSYDGAPGLTATFVDGSAGVWWLRSPYADDTTYAGVVYHDGTVNNFGVDYAWAARPAFNLDLTSVLFTSAAVGGKIPAAGSGGNQGGEADDAIFEIGDYTGNEWKLTLLDESRDFAVTEKTASGKPGDTITLNYTGATTGTNEYISVIIADSSGAQYYGRVAQPDTDSGTVNVTIPSGLADGTYTLYVFSEQYNGGEQDDTKLTDYASAFETVALTVSSDTTAPTLTPGSATRDSETAATVKFTSDEAGEYYYAVVESGVAEPSIDTTEAGISCDTTEQTISLTSLSGAGAKDIYIVAKDAVGNVSQQLKITIPAYIAPSYGISASPPALDFGSKTVGYTEAPAAQTVTLTNTGNQTVTVNLPVGANYTITAGDSFAGGAATLAPNGTAAFTVQPNTGLGVGTYAETLTVSGGSDVSASIELSFTVLETYTLTVDLNGGSGSTIGGEYTAGEVVNIDAGSRSNYRFDGWTSSNGGSFADASSASTTFTMPAADTTITAAWSYIGGGGSTTDYYRLTFETNGGSEISSIRRAEYTTIDLTDYTPTREGYEFTGWYADEDLTEKITSIRLIRNTTVYAGWEEIKENPGTGFENPFTDVSENDWFYDDVMFVFINELMIGTSDTTFTPYGTTTRAMVATTLWRMDGSPEPEGENSFTDVENGKWYTEAITWAHENGITVGYGDNLFGTNDPVTREQLAAFFYRYAEYKGYDTTITDSLDRFIDKDDVSDWAKDAMAWAIGYGLIEGRENNVLDPKDNATRAEFAAMLHRFCERNELEKGITATGLTGWINPNMTTGVPQTGDSSHTTLWTSMLLFSLAACIAMIIALKRQKETGDEAQLINP